MCVCVRACVRVCVYLSVCEYGGVCDGIIRVSDPKKLGVSTLLTF